MNANMLHLRNQVHLRQSNRSVNYNDAQRLLRPVPLVVALLLHVGCSETVQTPPQATQALPASKTDASVALPPQDSKLPTETPATTSPTHTATADTEEGTKRQSNMAILATAQAPTPPVRPVAKPTPEQITRWTQARFEPLQLLACRDSLATGFVNNMAMTNDGRHFILAGTRISLCSITSATPEHVFLEMPAGQTVKSLAVSPNGEWFAAGDSEGTLHVWNISDRSERHSKKLYPSGVAQIAISPDAQDIATISYDDEITIWNAESLEQKQRFKVDTNGVKRMEYMTSELLVAAGETTSSWNIQTGKSERLLPAGRYNFTMARSPNGEHFLFAEKPALQLWNIQNQKPTQKLEGGFNSEELTAFSPDGQYLATANRSSVRIWDIASNRLVQIMDTFGSPIAGLNWLANTNVLVIASENGRTRIWGTPTDGNALQLSPLHAAFAMPETNSHTPATSPQLLQCIDFRTFPRLPASTTNAADAFALSYEAAVAADEAAMFYRYQFNNAGWQETNSAAASPNTLRFRKDGFTISASLYESANSRTSISLNFAGNYDVRWAPKFDSTPIEIVFENEDTVIYRTKADLLQIETTLLRKMHDAGWTAYARLQASQADPGDGRHMEFLWNGTALRVSISRLPAAPESYNVQYSRFLTTNTIPIPTDSGFVEFDGSTQPNLVASTTMNLADTRSFYDTQLAEQGWLVRHDGRSIKDDQNWLPYVRGQQELTVGLHSLPTGRTQIRVGDNLENASWQLAKPTKTVESDTGVAGIQAADFPILNASRSATFDATGMSIDFSMETLPLPDVGDLYTKEMQSSGWKLDGPGIKSADYVFLTFVSGKTEIALRGRIKEGKSVINIQGGGLLWTKPLPGGRKRISYENWLRTNQHPATLELLDQYQAEMRSIPSSVTNAEKNE